MSKALSRAVVLAGGGARGAYQIGVWQALRELGTGFDIVTGASIGAMNAALMCQGDFDRARDLWLSLTTDRLVAVRQGREHVRRLEGGKIVEFIGDMARYGGADTALLEKTLREVIDEGRVRSSPVSFGLSASRFPSMRPVQLTIDQVPLGMLADYLAASSTYAPVFRSKEIAGSRYMDGGFSDNLPVELALQMGATELIAVDLGSSGAVHRPRSDIPMTFVSSAWSLGPALHFSPENSRRNIALGYLDTLRAFHKIEGRAYGFYLHETSRNATALAGAFMEMEGRSALGIAGRLRGAQWSESPAEYRRRRVLGRGAREQATMGEAVTAAAERAGREMALPPESLYRFDDYNTLLLDRVMNGGNGREGNRLREYCRMVITLCRTGELKEKVWKRLATERELTAAAIYVLACAMRYRNATLT